MDPVGAADEDEPHGGAVVGLAIPQSGDEDVEVLAGPSGGIEGQGGVGGPGEEPVGGRQGGGPVAEQRLDGGHVPGQGVGIGPGLAPEGPIHVHGGVLVGIGPGPRQHPGHEGLPGGGRNHVPLGRESKRQGGPGPAGGEGDIAMALERIWLDWQKKQLIEPLWNPVGVDQAVATILSHVQTKGGLISE